MNVKVLILSLLVIFLTSCKEDQINYQQLQIGQTKQEIKILLGTPYEIASIIKTKGHIWGPEEEFWSKIQNGTKLEVWSYKNDTGHLNLYFTSDNNHLAYKAFAPKGVVYESAN